MFNFINSSHLFQPKIINSNDNNFSNYHINLKQATDNKKTSANGEITTNILIYHSIKEKTQQHSRISFLTFGQRPSVNILYRFHYQPNDNKRKEPLSAHHVEEARFIFLPHHQRSNNKIN